MVTDLHVVIKWRGMPDNDPTEILTGASAAGHWLCVWRMFWNCVRQLRTAETDQTRTALDEKGLSTTDMHPKDGAVIHQDGNVLSVRSNLKGTVWYLNGKRRR